MNFSRNEPTFSKQASADGLDGDRLGKYRGYLIRQARNILPSNHNRIEQSDIVQQTLLEAHERLDHFRGKNDAEMAQWLKKMLANNVTDAVRALHRKKRDIRKERRLHQSSRDGSCRVGEWLRADQTSPSLNYQKAEQAIKLTDAISQLPEAQRQVVILQHLNGESLSEVAAHIGRSQSAVAGLLFRGLKTLRSLLSVAE